jgi:hypothetical protein
MSGLKQTEIQKNFITMDSILSSMNHEFNWGSIILNLLLKVVVSTNAYQCINHLSSSYIRDHLIADNKKHPEIIT